MAGQGVERREMMRILGLASVASTFPGFRRWVFACEHHQPARDTNSPDSPYQPQFFSADEYAVVERLAELIIPSDGTPGAREAGVSEFIDFMVSCDTPIQEPFRYGLAWLQAHAIRLFDKPFLELSPDQQTGILARLAYKDRFQPGEEEGQRFFRLMRDYTVMGFYTSRIGMEQLDYPGLKTTWSELPGCPHRDDPEHLHLPPPRG